MKSNKAWMLVLAAALAAIVVAAPATASAANWTKNGNELTSQLAWYEGTTPLADDETRTLSASGSFSFNSGASCTQADISAILVGGPGEAAGITEFAIDPSSCTVTGTLKNMGCDKVTSVTYNAPNGAALLVPQGEDVLAITNTLSLTFKFSGTGFCGYTPSATLSGSNAIATLDDSEEIGNLTFSGALSNSLFKVSDGIGGTVTADPAGAYGVDTAHSVELDGYLEFGLGGCAVDGRLALDPGSTGRVTEVNWSECTGHHIYNGCTITKMTTNGSPWTATDNGSTISISGVSFTMSYECPYPVGKGSRTFSGELTATPDKTSAISSTTLSGTLSAEGFNPSAVGSLDWSPAGVYGL